MGRTHDETDKGCDEQRLLIDLKVLSIGFLLIDLKGLVSRVFFQHASQENLQDMRVDDAEGDVTDTQREGLGKE